MVHTALFAASPPLGRPAPGTQPVLIVLQLHYPATATAGTPIPVDLAIGLPGQAPSLHTTLQALGGPLPPGLLAPVATSSGLSATPPRALRPVRPLRPRRPSHPSPVRQRRHPPPAPPPTARPRPMR